MATLLVIGLLFGASFAKNVEEINVNSRDELGNTPLHKTAMYDGEH